MWISKDFLLPGSESPNLLTCSSSSPLTWRVLQGESPEHFYLFLFIPTDGVLQGESPDPFYLFLLIPTDGVLEGESPDHFYLFLLIPTDGVLQGGSTALVTSLFPTTHSIWKQGGRVKTKINLPQILFYIWLEKHRGRPENKSFSIIHKVYCSEMFS